MAAMKVDTPANAMNVTSTYIYYNVYHVQYIHASVATISYIRGYKRIRVE